MLTKYDKTEALARLENALADLRRLRDSIEKLPESLSARGGTDIDAADCSRLADDVALQCREIGLALGFETSFPMSQRAMAQEMDQLRPASGAPEDPHAPLKERMKLWEGD
jgi:hypothetical protein